MPGPPLAPRLPERSVSVALGAGGREGFLGTSSPPSGVALVTAVTAISGSSWQGEGQFVLGSLSLF